MSSTLAIIGQINAISDYVADDCLSVFEMQKILDAIEDAHRHIQAAKDRLPRTGTPSNEGMFG
jgi:hypothetical protein